MLYKYINRLKSTLQLPIQKSDREEFFYGIQEMNVARGKITAITFLFVELGILIITLNIKKENIFQKPDAYYGLMYLLMIVAMTVFLLIFNKVAKDISKYILSINIIGIVFVGFILGWCAGISLLDLLSGGEILIYTAAVIAIAVTPLYRPSVLLFVYFIIHTAFLCLLPQFNASGDHLFGYYINSTTILIISFSISYMRYRNRAEDFIKNKKLQESSEELKRLNLELEDANHRLEILSLTDGLTGIYNRMAFDKILKREWKRCKKHQKYISLIMIDIDYFKAFNDNYGHQAGDACLKQVAEEMSECVEETNNAVVRYGGEEFAIILPYMGEKAAKELAEKLCSSIEKLNIRHEYSSISGCVTISLGVNTVIPMEELSIEEFIRKADMALYDAKKGNRNRVVVA